MSSTARQQYRAANSHPQAGCLIPSRIDDGGKGCPIVGRKVPATGTGLPELRQRSDVLRLALSSQSAGGVAVVNDLRYSARRLTRTPGLAVALVLTIAMGIGSNAAVYGFVRGLVARDMPLPAMAGVVSVLGGGADRAS